MCARASVHLCACSINFADVLLGLWDWDATSCSDLEPFLFLGCLFQIVMSIIMAKSSTFQTAIGSSKPVSYSHGGPAHEYPCYPLRLGILVKVMYGECLERKPQYQVPLGAFRECLGRVLGSFKRLSGVAELHL